MNLEWKIIQSDLICWMFYKDSTRRWLKETITITPKRTSFLHLLLLVERWLFKKVKILIILNFKKILVIHLKAGEIKWKGTWEKGRTETGTRKSAINAEKRWLILDFESREGSSLESKQISFWASTLAICQ